MVSDTQFVTTVEDADNINHLVIFLTGTQPFPDGFGGSGIFSKYNISSEILINFLKLLIQFTLAGQIQLHLLPGSF